MLLDWKPAGNPGTFAMIDDIPKNFPALWAIEQFRSLYPKRTVGKVMLSKLVPGQFIEPHLDAHDSRCEFRVHIPITTNDQCLFCVEDEVFHMKRDNAYEINPTKRHFTFNYGNTDRVHLIFNMRT